jgi:peptidoglycan/xylan/chitin deacetylase (PgdA/CDA1 family)
MNGAAIGTLLLFWDYDTQWGGDRSRSGGGPKDWGPLEFTNTERLLELHAAYAIPACFAVVGAAALPGERPYHDPGQVRRIHAAGHEVGSHAFRHEWLPALGPSALRESLVASRDALEQCIGDRVVTFVPPFNQPFDYFGGASLSLAERREVPRDRTDLPRLCDALRETGFRLARVAYRPIPQRVAERLTGRRFDRPARLTAIRGLACIRLNTPGGFDAPAVAMVERVAREGGIAVVYGHPHSLRGGGPQDERHLVPFLERVRELARDGLLRIALPRELVAGAAR